MHPYSLAMTGTPSLFILLGKSFCPVKYPRADTLVRFAELFLRTHIPTRDHVSCESVPGQFRHGKLSYLPCLVDKHLDGEIRHDLPGIDVDHVLVQAQPTLKQFLVGQVEHDVTAGGHVDTHHEVIGFSCATIVQGKSR